MHIPTAKNHTLQIERFADALAQSRVQSHIAYDVRD